MNFSDNKLRRLLSLTLCVCLTAALLAGCKKDDKTPASSDSGLNLITDDTTAAPAETQPQTTEPTVKITFRFISRWIWERSQVQLIIRISAVSRPLRRSRSASSIWVTAK